MSTPVAPPTGRRTLVSVLVGAVAAVAGAVVLATVIGVTEREIGFGVIAIGALVGFAMSRTVTPTRALAPVAAALSLFGCMLGEVMGVAALFAKGQKLPVAGTVLDVVTHPGVAVDVLKASFSPMSLLFWAIAVYAGFNFVRKAVAELEAQLAAQRAAAQAPVADVAPSAGPQADPAL